MTARFVIVHTDERGNIETLATVVYADRAEGERRVAERRRTAAGHGWSDRYELFELVPVDAQPSTEADAQRVRAIAGLIRAIGPAQVEHYIAEALQGHPAPKSNGGLVLRVLGNVADRIETAVLFPGVCSDCGLPVVGDEQHRDKRHDHCGPLPHTGPAGGPHCERCA